MLVTNNELAEHQVDPMTDLTGTELRVHPSRGRCLHAKHAVARGEVLFTEISLVAWQLPDNADAVRATLSVNELIRSTSELIRSTGELIHSTGELTSLSAGESMTLSIGHACLLLLLRTRSPSGVWLRFCVEVFQDPFGGDLSPVGRLFICVYDIQN
jgi:uncharacterized Fe-S cluster protein YjdI